MKKTLLILTLFVLGVLCCPVGIVIAEEIPAEDDAPELYNTDDPEEDTPELFAEIPDEEDTPELFAAEVPDEEEDTPELF